MNISYLKGKKGRIYAARNGSVIVFALENGETYSSSTTSLSNGLVKVNSPEWWVNSIDWECGFSTHCAHRMAYDSDGDYPIAKQVNPLNGERIEKLKRFTE
jgi:hypothetical protein